MIPKNDIRTIVREFSSPMEMDCNMWVIEKFLEGLKDMGYKVVLDESCNCKCTKR